MLLRIYIVFALLIAGWFTTAAVGGWRMFPARPPGASSGTGGGRGSGGSHTIWYGGK